MKRTNYLKNLRWLLCLPLLSVVACHSGWDKDPFADQPDTVKYGVPPELDQKGTPPVTNVLFIDVEPSYLIKEGEELNIEIKPRKAHDGFRIEKLVVNNLAEVLPGATFDEQTNQLSYKLENGTFPDGLLFFSRKLTISLFAEYEGLLHELRQDIVVMVLRGSAEDPKIIKVEGLKKTLKEGEINYFNIFVKDTVSPNGPNISIIKNDRTKTKNGSQYVDYKSIAYPVPNEPGMWFFKASLRLDRDEDVTPDYDSFNFIIQAYSVFGVPSIMNRQSFNVYTKANYPHFFMNKEMEATVGKSFEYTFSVVDLKREGKVESEFKDCSSLVGATCICQEIDYGSTRDSASCTLTWTPQEAGTYSLNLSAVNRVNLGTPFEDNKSTSAVLTINVKEKGATQ